MIEVEPVTSSADSDALTDVLVAVEFIKGAQEIIKGEIRLAEDLNVEIDVEDPHETLAIANEFYKRLNDYICSLREQIIACKSKEGEVN